MKQHTIKFGFIATIVALITASCSSRVGLEATNVSYAYNVKDLALRPSFYVYHLNDSISEVYYRVSSEDLLYVRNDQRKYESQVGVQYTLLSDFEAIEILDSGLTRLSDQAIAPPKKAIFGSFKLKFKKRSEDHQYILHLVLKDFNRKVEFDNFLRINKKPSYNGQGHFLMTDMNGNIIFKNHVPSGVPFWLKHNKKKSNKYWVSYYNRSFPLALPPYSTSRESAFELEPDSLFQIDANSPISLPLNGFYHFRLDTASWEGFTVYSFYKSFPFIAKREHLALPLRYLTTKKEYEELSAVMGDPKEIKKKVDLFWMGRSGSLERSKVVLKAYYNRVQEANMLFTSYLEGWKTDRGIIYVIYGPPDKVFRSKEGEEWVYGNETSSLSYRFFFSKLGNPFSENDYALNRSSSYRYGWGVAIKFWRDGHIYNSKDIKREQNEQDRYNQRAPYWY